MKKFCSSSLFIFIFYALCSTSISAQESSNLYLKVDYFKAPTDQIGNYLHVEQELWKLLDSVGYD